MIADDLPACKSEESRRTEAEVLEVPLLLPAWQATALEEVAHRQGLTAGALTRRLIGDFLRRFDPAYSE
jgi:hypothetical protein